MFNLASLIIGFVALVCALVAVLPLLGWLNWLIIPLAVVGAAIGGVIDYSFLRVAGDKAINFYHQRYLVDHGLAAPTVQPGAAIAALPPGAGRAVDASAGAAPPLVLPHSTPKRRERPPERFGVYLAVFAVIAMLLTIAACTALVIIVTTGGIDAINSLFPKR